MSRPDELTTRRNGGLEKREPGKRGYVYILINPAFAGFVKIGKTTKDPEVRAREVSAGSGVPAPYAVAWDVLVDDCDHVERMIHQQLAPARSRKDRELFQSQDKKCTRDAFFFWLAGTGGASKGTTWCPSTAPS